MSWSVWPHRGAHLPPPLSQLQEKCRRRAQYVIDPAALDLLASRLRTSPQIEDHLTFVLETGYQASEKPVSEAIIDSILSKQIDDLEPTMARHGYTVQILSELPGAGRRRSRRCSARRLSRTALANSRNKCSRRGCRCECQPRRPGHGNGRFPDRHPPAGCNDRAHGRRIVINSRWVAAISRRCGIAGCNQPAHARPMIAVPRPDDCRSLQVWRGRCTTGWTEWWRQKTCCGSSHPCHHGQGFP